MIGNHKDTNKYPINLLIINYLLQLFVVHTILFYPFLNSFLESEKENSDRKASIPWASIHAMVVALLPNQFCSIVSENNLNALYKHLVDIAPDVESKSDEKDLSKIDRDKITIDYKGDAWQILVKNWNASKQKEKENMSWYYKSTAIYDFFKKVIGQDYDKWKCDYPWEVLSALRGSERINQLKDRLLKQKNLILTGAPGTGKTYLAKQIASRIFFENQNTGDVTKSNELKKTGRYEFVQFHPSYDYTDFVEGLRPQKTSSAFTRTDGVFKAFCVKAAIAEKEDEELDENKKRRFVFVIDEINRGEISKIFGELFFSIDPGYRGENNKVNTQYQNINPKASTYPFSEGFYVPRNVYIIGTMNDIDRSVESMDFAFRRRFAFYEVSAVDSEAMIYAASSDDEDQFKWDDNNRQAAVDRMESLNKAITTKCGLSEQYQIGGAYFLKLRDVDFNFDDLWEYYLKGTLYEYFRGLPSKDIEDKMKILKDAYNNGSDD